MAGSNGYGTIEQLRRVKRLQRDFTGWPEMKLRVQALTDEQALRVISYSRQGVDPSWDDQAKAIWRELRDREANIAFGLVQPNLTELAEDERTFDEAIAIVQANIPPGVQAELSALITTMTWRPAAQAYKDFDVAADSPAVPAATASGTSDSASSSESGTPDS